MSNNEVAVEKTCLAKKLSILTYVANPTPNTTHTKNMCLLSAPSALAGAAANAWWSATLITNHVAHVMPPARHIPPARADQSELCCGVAATR
jgi:hypothetical protein